jgi:tRNA(Ile)-lysidine synthase
MTATNIETFARRMRFQALGRACKDLHSLNLLFGHHCDDQVETVLMRLALGHTTMLSGIRKVANIPECFGLHGISESGSYLPLPPFAAPLTCGVAGIEQGGVEILRPLLDFSKSRLLATCQKFGMPWYEDETNNDKTLTIRNAIRYIIERHHLPEALRSQSLIGLCRRKQEGRNKQADLVNKLFDKMPLALDLRSGVATVQFPELNFEMISEALLPRRTSFEQAYTVAQLLIHRIASLVCPDTHPELGQFNGAVEPIFRIRPSDGQVSPLNQSLNPKGSLKLKVGGSMSSFQVCGVRFDHLSKLKNKETSMEWRLWRIPAVQKDAVVSSAGPKSSHVSLRITPTSDELKSDQVGVFYIWDARFWIHVYNPASHDLWVRPLGVDSIASLRTLLASRKAVLRSTRGNQGIMCGADKHLDKLLRQVAEGKIRWALPVILSYTPLTTGKMVNGEAEPSTPQILAFPTLGLRIEPVDDGLWPDWVKDLKWEVRYKKIDLGTKRLEDCLGDCGRRI